MAYPPTSSSSNAIQQALDRRDTMQTVQLSSDERSSSVNDEQTPGDEVERQEREVMRLKGGCFSLEPCG
ncbi:hypothetical protein JCM5353_003721, partial [Sporobolomyces roseus]